MIQQYHSSSPAETESFAADFSKSLHGGEIIAFRGELGQGKTCFVRGLAKGLGCTDDVTSPTFALVNVYNGGRLPLYHFDMYRVSGWEDLYSTGYFDYAEAGGVLAVEWSENIENALPDDVITVTLVQTGETDREITVERRETA
ncbi:MAG: tRNA (adenosine(37)-N6)-threonylcarbamoyltransferase complex ATPase subunit type 1 TsaE [Clostridia bacterium]|nr:tRNA (adenosine(37)-N6)-threonylcarbamoyltransferase complex ATPase subunit type 1 TsaE [Clostridia bacterium]